MAIWVCYFAVSASAACSAYSMGERVVLILGGSEHSIAGEVARSVSGFLARRMRHARVLGKDGAKILLAGSGPGYLGRKETRGARCTKSVLGRVLQGTCGGFWRRVQLAGYLKPMEKTVRCVCRHVNTSVEEARGERTEAETVAMDRLYVHMTRELLAQNRDVAMDSEANNVYVQFEDQDGKSRYTLIKDRSKVEKVVFCFKIREVVGSELLGMLWTWLQLVFPRAKSVALDAIGAREGPYKSEVRAVVELGNMNAIELFQEAEHDHAEDITLDKLPLPKSVGLFGRSINDENIRVISQCSLEVLTLRIRGKRGAGLHSILQGEIRKSLKRLRVEDAEYLGAEDMRALMGLRVLKELELEGVMSSECLRAMGGEGKVSQALQGVVVRIQMYRPSEEDVRLLYEIEADELEIYGVSVRTVELLFLRARDSRLAGRIRRLKLHISGYEQGTSVLEGMSFQRLERLELHVLSETPVKDIGRVLGSSMKAKVSTFFVRRRTVGQEELVPLVAELGNLVELTLIRGELERGDIQKMLVEKDRLEQIVLYQTLGRRSTGIGVEDAQSIVQLKRLRVLAICDQDMSADVLETIIGNETFVRGLERLRISARILAVSAETRAKLERLGTGCGYGNFVELDTGTVSVVVERRDTEDRVRRGRRRC